MVMVMVRVTVRAARVQCVRLALDAASLEWRPMPPLHQPTIDRGRSLCLQIQAATHTHIHRANRSYWYCNRKANADVDGVYHFLELEPVMCSIQFAQRIAQAIGLHDLLISKLVQCEYVLINQSIKQASNQSQTHCNTIRYQRTDTTNKHGHMHRKGMKQKGDITLSAQ